MSLLTTHPDSRPAIALINHQHLRHNYSVIQQQNPNTTTMAVVKANAYGHGMQEIATTLYDSGCRSFAVTDAREGSSLRQSFEALPIMPDIILLSGLFNPKDANLAAQASLTPIITETQHIHWLEQAGFHGQVWIKIDSGMHRIGARSPAQIIAQCQQARIEISGLMSHLACADDPAHPLNLQQIETFNRICKQTAPDLPRSLLNSAGIIAMPEHSMAFVRPGIALYGIEPIPTQTIGLKPVMSLLGSIMQLRNIPAGANISYGASFTAKQPMRIATVSLGYADGVPRGLSNLGNVHINTSNCPIIGRVCMDYSLIDVSHIDSTMGDQVEFWGEHIAINTVASQLNTISYTLLTGVGNRVQRLHRL